MHEELGGLDAGELGVVRFFLQQSEEIGEFLSACLLHCKKIVSPDKYWILSFNHVLKDGKAIISVLFVYWDDRSCHQDFSPNFQFHHWTEASLEVGLLGSDWFGAEVGLIVICKKSLLPIPKEGVIGIFRKWGRL